MELDSLDHIYSSYSNSEQLIELEPLDYRQWNYIEHYYEEFDDGYTPQPENYRSIIRLTGGNLVIFRKTSSYNLTPSTYDGRHGEMGVDGFRDYIQRLINMDYKVSYNRNEEGTIVGKYISHDIRNYK